MVATATRPLRADQIAGEKFRHECDSSPFR